MLSSSCFLESESNPSIDYTFTEFYTGLDDKMLTAVHAENVKLLVCVVVVFEWRFLVLISLYGCFMPCFAHRLHMFH